MLRLFLLILAVLLNSTSLLNAKIVKSGESENALLKKKIVAMGTSRKLPFNVKASPNDYVSYAIYYWENPASKDSPYIVIDGKKNEYLISLSDAPKRRDFVNTVRQLHAAYKRTQDPRYIKRINNWLQAWWVNPKTRMTPSITYGQIRPGHESVGMGGGIIDFADMPSFFIELQAIKKTKIISKRDWKAIDQWLEDYNKWLEVSPQGKNVASRKNNHKLYYILQRVTLNEYLGKPEKAKALIDDIFSQIDNYIDPNGAQPHEINRSKGFDYSIYTLDAWFQLNNASKRISGKDYWDVKSPKGASLNQAYLFLEEACNNPNQTIFKDKTDINRLKRYKL